MTTQSILGLDEAKRLLGEFQFHEFSTVQALRFVRRSKADNEYDLYLLLDRNRSETTSLLEIEFEAVADLSIRGFGGGLTQIVGLGIRNITARGWEGKYWEVSDYENSSISFYCRTVRVSVNVGTGS